MMWDLTVKLENQPGTIADLGEALGAAGINIHGVCGFPCEGAGIIHVLVDDPDASKEAFAAAELEAGSERPVLVIDLEDRPGELGKHARRMADAGVNVDLLYLTADSRLVFGVDDLDKAKAAQ